MQSSIIASPSAELSRSFQDAADPLQTQAVFALKWHEKPAPACRGFTPEILMNDSCRRNGAAILGRSSRHAGDVTSLSFDQPEDARQ